MDEGTRGTLFLLDAARSGEASAIEELFTRYYPRVLHIVALRLRRTCRDLEEHEDVVQETLLQVFRALDDFEVTSVAAFRSYLARVAENRIRDRSRRRRAVKRGEERVVALSGLGRTTLCEMILPDERGSTPTQAAAAAELEERLERALLALDERARHLIELRKLCEMSYAEIAVEMGLGAESSARAAVARALSQLSGLL